MRNTPFSLTLVTIIMLVTSTLALFVNAQSQNSEEHIHGENCIYNCEQDNIDVSLIADDNHSHIDHDYSEDCLYSCTHAINNYLPSSKGTNITIKDPYDGQELKDILDEYTGVATESLIESKKVYAEMMGIYVDSDTTKYTDEAVLKTLIDEYTGVATNSLEESKKILADMMGVSVKELNERAGETSLYCLLAGHDIIVCGCVGNHSAPNRQCVVRCTRMMVCYGGGINNPCTWHEYFDIEETVHSWSVGWCGQTCTNCGIIQIFHQPGGCWYCS